MGAPSPHPMVSAPTHSVKTPLRSCHRRNTSLRTARPTKPVPQSLPPQSLPLVIGFAAPVIGAKLTDGTVATGPIVQIVPHQRRRWILPHILPAGLWLLHVLPVTIAIPAAIQPEPIVPALNIVAGSDTSDTRRSGLLVILFIHHPNDLPFLFARGVPAGSWVCGFFQEPIFRGNDPEYPAGGRCAVSGLLTRA